MSELPRVTFGMIVLNGEPFTRYNLRALYPFAHEIIVVEGAVPAAAGIARHDGHSRDATLETLREFKRREDPDDKLVVVTAEDEGCPDGFWPGEKDQQSRAYADRASGDYLWQVDIDEFYQPHDMEFVLQLLAKEPSITAVSFKQIQFWGGFDYLVDGWYLRRGLEQFHRLFRWGKGCRYETHRPPTVLTEEGRDMRSIRWVNGYSLERRGVLLYHYSLVFPRQVRDKCMYYANAPSKSRPEAEDWEEEVFANLRLPYRPHIAYELPSWLDRFQGQHPPQIEALRVDIENGSAPVVLRRTDDIERLLRSRRYRLGRAALRAMVPRIRPWNRVMLAYQRYLWRQLTERLGSLRKTWQDLQHPGRT